MSLQDTYFTHCELMNEVAYILKCIVFAHFCGCVLCGMLQCQLLWQYYK